MVGAAHVVVRAIDQINQKMNIVKTAGIITPDTLKIFILRKFHFIFTLFWNMIQIV